MKAFEYESSTLGRVWVFADNPQQAERILESKDRCVIDFTNLLARATSEKGSAATDAVRGQGSHNTTNYSIGLCAKKVPLYCASFDPASKNCEECELRPTA